MFKSNIDGKELKSLKSLLAYDCKRGMSKEDVIAILYHNGERKMCLCGCGQQTKYNTRKRDLSDYIQGHQSRVWNPTRDDKEIAAKAIKNAIESNRKKIASGEFAPWNKGESKETNESMMKISEYRKGKQFTSPEKISEGRMKYMQGLKDEGVYDTEYNKHMKEYWKDPAHRLEQSVRTSDRLLNSKFLTSKFETDVINFLKDNNINFKHQYRISTNQYNKVFDFRLDNNILLECDGDFLHCNPIKFPDGPKYKGQQMHIDNDILKNKIATDEGFKLVRIWHSEFYKNKQVLIEKIKGCI